MESLYLIDEKFGRLTVVSYAEHDKWHHIKLRCICDCGNEIVVSKSDLQREHTQSCGCYQKEKAAESQKINVQLRRKSYGEAAFNRLLVYYKISAKKRKLEFTLSETEFKELIFANCFYCGEKPLQIVSGHNLHGNILYNGIDRVNNDIGYITNNVVSCCGNCNLFKGTRTLDEFIVWIRRVYESGGFAGGEI